jgi:protein ThiW
VFDEPTSGMDGEGLLSMAQWVDALAQAGKTVVIITHDELLSELACDYRIRMMAAVAIS